MALKQKWNYKIRFNGKPFCIRDGIGDLIRRLASKIDGRMSVAISIETTPTLTTKTKIMLLKKGFNITEDLLEEELKMEASELLMKQQMPDLYKI